MPNKNSPIRWKNINEAKQFIDDLGLHDATVNQKLFFLFRERKSFEKALSFREIALVLHEDKTYVDKTTGEPRPDYDNLTLTRQEIKDFRKTQALKGVILYCISDEKTGAQMYYNIPTLELLAIIEKKNEKIIKGIKDNMKNAKKFLKLPVSVKRQVSKLAARQLRNEIMERLKKEMERKRKKEVQEVYA